MQRERVEDQYPWTWEVPLAVLCGLVVVVIAVCQLARSAANWFSGAGWLWPAPDRLVNSIPSLLAGDAAAGLSGVRHSASAEVLWGWLLVVGLLAVAGCAVAGVGAWRRWGPARMRGMATVTEAHQLLGVDRLWKVRHIVRPDLYPVGRRPGRV